MSLLRRRALTSRRYSFFDDFDADSSALYTEYGTNRPYTIGDGYLTFGGAATDTQTVWSPNGISFADGRVGCVLDQANDAGLAFRFVDNNNYYVAIIADNLGTDIPSRQVCGIWRKLSGSWFQLGSYASLPGGFVRGDTHKYEVRMSGSTFELWYDDALVTTRTDSSFASGRVGARANRAPCRFSSFYVN